MCRAMQIEYQWIDISMHCCVLINKRYKDFKIIENDIYEKKPCILYVLPQGKLKCILML